MTKEVWKEVSVCNGKYKISNLGRVKSMPNRTRKGERILKLNKYKNGYLNVDLCYEGIVKKFLVHRLVAIAFIPNPKDKPQVNHINGVKDNNSLNNLEWNTRSENQLHSIRTGLRSAKGANNSQSKLKEHEVKDVFNSNLEYKKLSLLYKISIPTIYDIKSKRTWSHITNLL